jgi:hypothetical protein
MLCEKGKCHDVTSQAEHLDIYMRGNCRLFNDAASTEIRTVHIPHTTLDRYGLG